MICDISKHQGKVDWDKLAPAVDFVMLKASKDLKHADGIDPYYERNAQACEEHGVPYHAYHMLYARNETEARTEAKLFAKATEGTHPLFYVIDAERPEVPVKNARAICEAFEDGLRHYIGSDIRVAVYIGNHLYNSWKLDYSRYAYVWIPRYGGSKPDHPCDLWQYTSTGKAPGIDGDVDLNKLTGTKSMEFFTGRTEPIKNEDTKAIQKSGGESTMFTGKQLAKFCEDVYKAGWVYWYGTYGKKCTNSLYESKKRQYPDHYTSDRKSGYMKDISEGKWCADCVGMIKGFFWKNGDITAEPKYGSNHCPDKSANGMIAICTQTGPIKTIPDEPGLVVWKSGHIGVYVGGGYTVEMKGFNYDCKRNKVTVGPWTKWGRLPKSMITYTNEEIELITPEPEGDRDLKNGDEGKDVKELQQNLISLGFSCGKWGADGDFGDCTEQAVEAFQRANGVDVTGIYDAATRKAMEKALDAKDEPAEEPRYVKIVGGNCYVRTAPNTSGKKLGVAHEGDLLTYQDQTSDAGWHLVIFKNQNGWVSGKYGKLQ